MKFATFAGAALAASATSALALVVPRDNGDVVARQLGALSGRAWAEQIEPRAALQERIVWNPKITQPAQSQVFIAGEPFVIEWNTNAPDGYNTDLPVYIKLGYDTGDSLHEYWDLVSDKDNIPIGKGHTIATLPADLQKRDDYVVIVFGDSGNASQKFKIVPKPGNKRDELVERIVYNPTITAPTSGQSFPAGSKTTVTWSVDGLPDSLKDSKVEIRLGYAPSKDDPGYHEKWELGHFPIQDAKAEVTLPSDLEPRSDYLFVVLGDSGNFSPHFTVTKN